MQQSTPLTVLTGRSVAGDFWAMRWSWDGYEGYGVGDTEREAIRAAEKNLDDNRNGR